MAQHLKAHKIVQTLEQLHARIRERFPGSGLAAVCADLVETARLTAARVRAARRPHLFLRTVTFVVVAAFLYALYAAARYLGLLEWLPFGQHANGAEVTQALESIVNLVILAAVAIWFLLTAEARIRRHVILGHLHELRTFAHVVDMHQLTKDPAVILGKIKPTASSPTRDMTEEELARYLDYCTEMLSLTGKLAALYEERSDDTEIIAAANDIEALTTNLGRKIWQKITLISSGPGFASGAGPASN
ncbi:MAG: hypothetical protein ACLFWF_06490 [Alphaproteobacteria bacterium]